MFSFCYCEYFLEYHQHFEGFLNNKSPQGTGLNVKEFTVNSNTNNSQTEESYLFREKQNSRRWKVIKSGKEETLSECRQMRGDKNVQFVWFAMAHQHIHVTQQEQGNLSLPHVLYRKIKWFSYTIQQPVDSFHWKMIETQPSSSWGHHHEVLKGRYDKGWFKHKR